MGGIPATAPNPSDSVGLQYLKKTRGGFLGPHFKSKWGLPVINIPGCPCHPDWVTQILVAIASGRAKDIALDDLQRPQTFFKTFTQTGCTRVQFYEYKQHTPGIRPGHSHRLPVLRVWLSGTDDPLPMQPNPLESAVVKDPSRHALHRLH